MNSSGVKTGWWYNRGGIIPFISRFFDGMERRGSGFKKICHDYESQANYKEELRPAFYSTYNDFVLTLYNLNYKVENGEVEIAPNCPKLPQIAPNLPPNVAIFLKTVMNFPGGTVSQLAKESGSSERMVKYYLQFLRDTGVIRRVGSNRKGYWEIIKHKEE